MAIRLKTKDDIAKLRRSGAILADVLMALRDSARPGMALVELDGMARALLKKAGAQSAFLGYVPGGMANPYPAAICTSVNATVVHGLPTEYVLRDGDILKIDTGVNFEGYITDSAVTVGIGAISKEAKRLLQVTEQSLEAGIRAVKPGNHVGDIGAAIEAVVTKAGFKVVRGLTGHGVGFALHEDPYVPNHGKRGEGAVLVPGLVIAIEPMTSVGSALVVEQEDESFSTKDGSISAHFEHTIAITEKGHEVLTRFK